MRKKNLKYGRVWNDCSATLGYGGTSVISD